MMILCEDDADVYYGGSTGHPLTSLNTLGSL